jgi:hypothetical protein
MLPRAFKKTDKRLGDIVADARSIVVGRLSYFHTKIESLAGLVSKQSLTREKTLAQQQMKEIKEQLALERKSLGEKERRGNLNPFEKALSRALHQASTHLHVRWNSNPNSTWLTELYTACSDISLELSRLQEKR